MGALPSYYSYENTYSFVDNVSYLVKPNRFSEILERKKLDHTKTIIFNGEAYNEEFIYQRVHIIGRIDVVKEYPDGTIMLGISNNLKRIFVYPEQIGSLYTPNK